MKVEINTDTNEVFIDGQLVEVIKQQITSKNPGRIADEFAMYRGATEYTGIVHVIQEWYYGSLVKSAWCATAMSYFANQCGLLAAIGGKNENVYQMMNACKRANSGTFYSKKNIPKQIYKGDILFWLWEGETMGVGSSKHVNIAEYDSYNGNIFAIGGNQKDKICTLEYTRDKLYAVYRIR